jgi:hypothetical protein
MPIDLPQGDLPEGDEAEERRCQVVRAIGGRR